MYRKVITIKSLTPEIDPTAQEIRKEAMTGEQVAVNAYWDWLMENDQTDFAFEWSQMAKYITRSLGIPPQMVHGS